MADNGPMYIRRATTIDMAQDMTYALEEREQYKEAIARIDMDKGILSADADEVHI